MNLIDEMKKCGSKCERFLHKDEPIAAKILLDEIFSTVNFSLLGSNARLKEESVICFWRDYVIDVEGTVNCGCLYLNLFLFGRIPSLVILNVHLEPARKLQPFVF